MQPSIAAEKPRPAKCGPGPSAFFNDGAPPRRRGWNRRHGKGNKIDLARVDEQAKILHYLGRNKPWDEKYRGILKPYYDKYRVK